MVNRIRTFCGSFLCKAILFLFASFMVIFDLQTVGGIVLISVISLELFFDKETAPTLFPFLILCMLMSMCYDSYDYYIQFWPLGILPVSALIFHFVYYKENRKFKIGRSFWGLLATGVAVTLGGIGYLSFSEYFSLISVFYMLGLGFGLCLEYFLLKGAYREKRGANLRDRVLADFSFASLLATVIVVDFYIKNTGLFYENPDFIFLQSANNLSTILLLAMPASACLAVRKSPFFMAIPYLNFITILGTGSRSGLLIGGFMLFVCTIYSVFYSKKLLIFPLSALLFVSVLVFIYRDFIFHYLEVTYFLNGYFISPNEDRISLMKEAWQDFSECPLFGKGICHPANPDISSWSPKKGAAFWYHNSLAQIIGSFGTVGIIAYAYQFIVRLRLVLPKKRERREDRMLKFSFALSWLGITLMSLVNPGEFCIPYAFLIVLLFVLIEIPENNEKRIRASSPNQI